MGEGVGVEAVRELTSGQAALECGGRVQVHNVVGWCNRGWVRHKRVGRWRIIPASELETLRTLARRHGLLNDAAKADPQSALVSA